MPTWIEAYNALREKMITTNGVIGNGRSGRPIPKMSATEPMQILAIFLDEVVRAIEQVNAGSKYGPATALVGADDEEWSRVAPSRAFRETISVQEWLVLGRPTSGDDSGEFAVRVVRAGVAHVRYHLRGGATGIAEARHIAQKWDRCIDLAAQSMAKIFRFPDLTLEECREFWSVLYQLIIAIENAIEAPRPSTWDMVKGGVKAATKETVAVLQDAASEAAELAGRAAAEVAETAGKAAGSAARGFFDQAGMTAIMVVGIALIIALR